LAIRLFEQSATLSRAEGDHHTRLGAHRNLGLIAQRQGAVEQARAHHAEALRQADQIQDSACMMQALAGLACVALESRHAERSARLLAVVARLHELTGMALTVYSSAGGFEQSIAALREELEDGAFEAAWSEGQSMSLDDAVAYALSAAAHPPTSASTPAKSSDPLSASAPLAVLTAREREVTSLIARGLSNRDIAGVLVLSERTVHVHVASILSKLGCRSRTQVAAMVADLRSGVTP
jgi:DNA-binding CsgD family transcriptional regulator